MRPFFVLIDVETEIKNTLNKSTVQNLQSKILGGDGAFRPHLAPRLATMTDGHVVLILLLQ